MNKIAKTVQIDQETKIKIECHQDGKQPKGKQERRATERQQRTKRMGPISVLGKLKGPLMPADNVVTTEDNFQNKG